MSQELQLSRPYPDLIKRRAVIEALKQGMSYRQVSRATGASSGLIRLVIAEFGGVVPRRVERSPLRLSLAEREEIAIGLSHGLSFRAIAAGLGRSVSTISREVERNGGRSQYRAWRAEATAQKRACRPKTAKLVKCRQLKRFVQKALLEKQSPQQIQWRLMDEFPGNPEMRISHEAIYQSLFIQGRGALRRELTSCLRTGRAYRRSQRREVNNGRIKDMVMISERPAEIEDRAVPGHWEGDLIIGKDGKSAIGTLVERHTRYVMLMKLKNQKAETVREALTATIQRLPAELFKTLTWDQGKELSQHSQFSIDTGIEVYFCDPHSPWQRGSNENTNGLLRQYFPKGTALSGHSQEHLDAVARQLNDRPRQTLNWMRPSQAMAQLLR